MVDFMIRYMGSSGNLKKKSQKSKFLKRLLKIAQGTSAAGGNMLESFFAEWIASYNKYLDM
jgi:hypothetical protein